MLVCVHVCVCAVCIPTPHALNELHAILKDAKLVVLGALLVTDLPRAPWEISGLGMQLQKHRAVDIVSLT